MTHTMQPKRVMPTPARLRASKGPQMRLNGMVKDCCTKPSAISGSAGQPFGPTKARLVEISANADLLSFALEFVGAFLVGPIHGSLISRMRGLLIEQLAIALVLLSGYGALDGVAVACERTTGAAPVGLLALGASGFSLQNSCSGFSSVEPSGLVVVHLPSLHVVPPPPPLPSPTVVSAGIQTPAA